MNSFLHVDNILCPLYLKVTFAIFKIHGSHFFLDHIKDATLFLGGGGVQNIYQNLIDNFLSLISLFLAEQFFFFSLESGHFTRLCLNISHSGLICSSMLFTLSTYGSIFFISGKFLNYSVIFVLFLCFGFLFQEDLLCLYSVFVTFNFFSFLIIKKIYFEIIIDSHAVVRDYTEKF